MARRKARWPLAVGAAVLLMVPVTAWAADADATDAPLHVFRPGAAGEPAWTMLEFDVTQPEADLEIRLTWSQLSCPFAWGFLIFEGPAPYAVQTRGVIFDYANGHQGAEAHVWSPWRVELVVLNHTGVTHRCNAESGWTLRFPDLPVGTIHLLSFTAGAPFAADAALTAPAAGIDLVATSHGERTFYAMGADFGGEGGYVGVHSPGFCITPSPDPATGFCNPGSYWHGGAVGGAEAGWDRRATVEFRDHPYFVFGMSSGASVSNATITDPLGHVTVAAAGAAASLGGLHVRPGSLSLVASGPVAQYASGTYLFDINFHADVGVKRFGLDPNWRVKGVDYQFPAEQSGGSSG